MWRLPQGRRHNCFCGAKYFTINGQYLNTVKEKRAHYFIKCARLDLFLFSLFLLFCDFLDRVNVVKVYKLCSLVSQLDLEPIFLCRDNCAIHFAHVVAIDGDLFAYKGKHLLICHSFALPSSAISSFLSALYCRYDKQQPKDYKVKIYRHHIASLIREIIPYPRWMSRVRQG